MGYAVTRATCCALDSLGARLRMSYIAPAGTPLSPTDLTFGLGAGLCDRRVHDRLADLLATHSERAQGWLVSSGRAGMTLLLRSMQRLADPIRNEVIIPGYTCYSVPASIERAGLKVRLCDIDPHTLSPDLDRMQRFDFSKVLCIVSANLYGLPNALSELATIARENGVFMLDDAAQALGARYESKAVGGFGDAGLYSFDKGKNITTIQGGALVADNGALADSIEHEYQRLPPPRGTLAYIAKLGAYSTLLRPRLYGITQCLPFLGLGRTPYERDCPTFKYSTTLAGLALRQARRLADINRSRIENATRLQSALEGVRGIRLPRIFTHASAVFPRFPIFVQDVHKRDALIASLNEAGIVPS